MKTAVIRRPVNRPVAYPNAATHRQQLHKVLDLLLTAAIGVGIAASLLFILTVL